MTRRLVIRKPPGPSYWPPDELDSERSASVDWLSADGILPKSYFTIDPTFNLWKRRLRKNKPRRTIPAPSPPPAADPIVRVSKQIIGGQIKILVEFKEDRSS